MKLGATLQTKQNKTKLNSKGNISMYVLSVSRDRVERLDTDMHVVSGLI